MFGLSSCRTVLLPTNLVVCCVFWASMEKIGHILILRPKKHQWGISKWMQNVMLRFTRQIFKWVCFSLNNHGWIAFNYVQHLVIFKTLLSIIITSDLLLTFYQVNSWKERMKRKKRHITFCFLWNLEVLMLWSFTAALLEQLCHWQSDHQEQTVA